ncbi:MAG: DUF2975 domain-containing protein [Oscillospiraceae bacterium]
MWTKSKSLNLTYSLVWLVLALLVAGVFLIPTFVRWYDMLSLRPSIFKSFCAALYASLVPAFAAMVRLCGMLGNIKKKLMFVSENTEHLRALSYCCFAECAVFFAFGFVRPLSFVLSFAACFFGLILRVLKNVFEEAVELRKENDAVI